MPIMLWDETLDIGVDAMNKEHIEILDAMNKIFDSHQRGETGEAINKLVGRLGEICVRHFADEERFMEKVAFPGVETHKLIHVKLLKDFGEHAGKIKAAGGKANEAFFQFLKNWLSAHIKGIDVKYAAHAKVAAH